MLITKKHFPLVTVFGERARVVFPFEYALEVHKKFPGLIRRMVHTHPDGMTFLSEEDRTTLKAWTIAFSPNFICMEVICRNGKKFFRKMFYYTMESLEDWIARGKEGERKMVLQEQDLSQGKQPRWVEDILYFSYEM